MGAGNVKKKPNICIEYKEEVSIDSLENNENLAVVMVCENEELSKHEDLLVQACFCEIPKEELDIYVFEKKVQEQKKLNHLPK